MKTVKELMEELKKYPGDNYVYSYEDCLVICTIHESGDYTEEVGHIPTPEGIRR